MSSQADISTAFLSHAAHAIAPYVSGAQIIRITSAYAVDYNKELPYPISPHNAPNKQSALLENLRVFEPSQQYQIIQELCDRVTAEVSRPNIVELKLKLIAQYGAFIYQYGYW